MAWRDAADFSLDGLTVRLSPNRDGRAGGRAPDLVVIHYTAMASAEAALERLCDPAAAVSAHYLVGRDGALWGLAPEAERAWHAGVSSWGGETEVNHRAIGIELDYPGEGEGLTPEEAAALGPAGVAPPFPEAQMARLEALLAAILARWSLPAQAVLGHSDVAPERKRDPGARFDWRRLARGGLAVAAPESAGGAAEGGAVSDWAAFRAAATVFGYGDWADAAVLEAMRRRFRPAALGRPFEPADAALMRRLAARWPAVAPRAELTGTS